MGWNETDIKYCKQHEINNVIIHRPNHYTKLVRGLDITKLVRGLDIRPRLASFAPDGLWSASSNYTSDLCVAVVASRYANEDADRLG